MAHHESELRLYLEELDSNAGEHELQERRDNHDVPNGSDGNEHALNHVLWGERGGPGKGVSLQVTCAVMP